MCVRCVVIMSRTIFIFLKIVIYGLIFKHLQTLSFFENMEWKEWLVFNLNKSDVFNGVPWPIIFGVALDNLWLRRNQVVFQQTNMSSRHLYHWVMTMAHNIVSSHKYATTAAHLK